MSMLSGDVHTPDKVEEYGEFAFDLEKSIVAEFEDVSNKTIFKRIFG